MLFPSRLVLGNLTSLVGREPELVRDLYVKHWFLKEFKYLRVMQHSFYKIQRITLMYNLTREEVN